MPLAKYDSKPDTEAHISRVQQLIGNVRAHLEHRARVHDASKLLEPEKSAFDECTARLKSSTYGSDEYKGFLAELKPALDHHYANNSHHPEHYSYLECNGCFKRFPREFNAQCDQCGYGQFTARANVDGMSLLDLIEMLCDWKAAGERHSDGSMVRSLSINQERFKIGPQLQSILENTAKEMDWMPQ